jgi:hypothetical protein
MDVITANIRTDVVEGKCKHAISWKWDGHFALPSGRYRRIGDQTGTSDLPLDWNRPYTFPRTEAFCVCQAPKARGAPCRLPTNLCAVAFLQQSCDCLLLFSNAVPLFAYYSWRDQETSRQDKRKVVEMLFLHLKPGSHWRIVAYEDRGMHSVDEPHIPLIVVQDESDGTLMRSAKLRERAILGWEESPQPSELPN